jgi:hypothetical protein
MLRVSENRVLRKTFWTKWEKVLGIGQDCITIAL